MRFRSQHARRHALKQPFSQKTRDVDRAGFQKNAPPATLDPEDIVFQFAAAKHFQFAFDLSGTSSQRFPFSREVFLFLQRVAGIVKRGDQSVHAFEFAKVLHRETSISHEGESTKESV
jgi:hypothetical protein